MNVQDWLNKVAYRKLLTLEDPMNVSFLDDRKEYEVWLSNFDNSYITHVGMEDSVKFLADLEITSNLTHGVGFSPANNKWYGWSHRAICGFTIGSTCKKGACHYNPKTLAEQKEAAIDFWKSEDHTNVRCEGIIEKDGEKFFDIRWEYVGDINKNYIQGCLVFIAPLGRGEWTAMTMEDAKQMAIDFNNSVS